jgi:hypothetical protein
MNLVQRDSVLDAGGIDGSCTRAHSILLEECSRVKRRTWRGDPASSFNYSATEVWVNVRKSF